MLNELTRANQRIKELEQTLNQLSNAAPFRHLGETTTSKADKPDAQHKIQLQTLLETIPSAVVMVEANGILSYVNQRGKELYGTDYTCFDLDSHISKIKAQRTDGSPFPLEEMPVSHSLKLGATIRNVEMIIQHVDGTRNPVLVSSSPIFDEQERITAAVVIFEEISERKKMEEALRESEERYREQIKFAPALIYELDLQIMRFSFVNDLACEVSGYSRDELLAMNPFDIIDDQCKIAFQTRYSQLLNGEVAPNAEYKIKCKDGRVIDVFLNIISEKDKNGKPLKSMVSGQDITERKKAEKALRESEEKYRGLFEKMTEMFPLLEPIFDENGRVIDFRYIKINKATEALTGMKREEMEGRTVLELYGFVEDYWFEMLDRALKTHEPIHMTDYSKAVDLYYDVNAWDAGDGMVAIVASNITERKWAEKKLQDYKLHLEELVLERTREVEEAVRQKLDLLESISDCFYSLDKELCFTYINKGAEQAWGVSRAELIGKKIEEVFPGAIELSLMKFRQVLAEKSPQHYELFSDVSKSWVYMSVYPSTDGISVFWQDITERKQAEEALWESKERYSSLFENSLDGIILNYPDGMILDANPAACRMFGRTKDELCTMGRWRIVDKEDPRVMQAGEERSRTGRFHSEMTLVRNDGTRFEAEVTSNLYKDSSGKLLSSMIIRDVSERKRLETEIARLDRLNLIGEMAASIGHEIRNPITTIRGFLQMLKGKEFYEDDRIFFELMIEELDRANDIISEYLRMAKDKRVDLQAQYLDEVVKSIYPMIQADANYNEMDVKLDLGKPPMLLIDTQEIRQLLINMSRNGLEAMSSGGILTIGTSIEGNEIILYIKDHGCGLDTSLYEKLGTPFLTTKEKGTGLGLAVCYSIAARHNARIDYETGPLGTTFFVRFPTPLE
ncbi:MAG: PAS domain S-box protein [Syntrophomonas sp.]